MKPDITFGVSRILFAVLAFSFIQEAPAAGLEPGIEELVLIQRKPLNPTHVYTYHVEGLAKGGGLFTRNVKDGKLTRLIETLGEVLDEALSSGQPANAVADRIARQRIAGAKSGAPK